MKKLLEEAKRCAQPSEHVVTTILNAAYEMHFVISDIAILAVQMSLAMLVPGRMLYRKLAAAVVKEKNDTDQSVFDMVEDAEDLPF